MTSKKMKRKKFHGKEALVLGEPDVHTAERDQKRAPSHWPFALVAISGCLLLVWLITALKPFKLGDTGPVGTFLGPVGLNVSLFTDGGIRVTNDVSGRRLAMLAWVFLTVLIAACIRFTKQDWAVAASSRLASLASKIKQVCSKRGHEALIWGCVFGFIAISFWSFLCLPGLTTSPAAISNHFEEVLGIAGRVSLGDRIYDITTPDYGVLSSTFVCLVERVLGLLSIGGVLYFMEWFNLAWVLTITFLLWDFSRHKWLPFLLGILLFAPWYSPIFGMLIPPNHSGFRIAPFALMLLTLSVLGRMRIPWRALLLGIASALGVAWNFEAGFAATGGACAYLAFFSFGRHIRLKTTGTVWGIYFLGWAVGVLLATVLASLMAGMWLPPSKVFAVSEFLRVAWAGSAGGPPPSSMLVCWLAAIMLGQATAVIVRLAFYRTACHRSAVNIAIATMVMVWTYYSMGRASIEYFAATISLYVILLAGELRSVLCGKSKTPIQTITLMVTFAVWVMYFSNNMNSMSWSMADLIRVPRWEAPLWGLDSKMVVRSEVSMPPEVAEFLDERSTKIRSEAASSGERPVYFSPLGFFISRMSGVPSAQFLSDPGMPPTKHAYDSLLQQTLALDREYIFIDTALQPGIIWYANFYPRFRVDIAHFYTYDHTECGWEIWRRKR